MKAIILAAGKGTRLGNLTKNKPKGMLNFNGKTLIEWQIELYRKKFIEEIIIVTGYKGHLINYKDVKYYQNDNFDSTNMIESLMVARNEFDDDVIVSYSDIIFSDLLLSNLIDLDKSICVSVDSDWKEYWLSRYGNIKQDLEDLKIADNGKIIHIGSQVSSNENLNYRYVGINKFSHNSLKLLENIYDIKRKKNENWKSSGEKFKLGYLTDLFQELIDNNIDVFASIYENNWLEIDTIRDYEIALKMHENKKFNIFN